MSGQRYSVTIDVGADISSAKSAAQQLKNVFEGIGLGAGQSSKISGMFRDLDKALDEVAKRSSTALTSIGEVKGLDKAKERVVSIINAINSEFSKMGKLGDTDLAKNFGDLTRRVNDASKAIKTYNSTIGSLNKGHAAAKSRANELGQELAEQTKYYEQLQKIRDKFNKGSSDKDISEALAKRQSTAKGLATRRQNELESFVKARGGRINVDKTVDKGWRKSFESKASAEDVETLNKLVTAAQSASNAFKTAQENYQNFSNAMSNFKGQKNFDELTKNAREAADELKKFESGTLSTEAFNKLKSALEQAFGPEVTAGIQNSATAVEEFQERINQISAKELDEFRKKVPEIDNLLNQLANTGEKMGEKVKKGTESFYNMKEAASDIDNLTYRLKYFFSLAGGFQLMRRAIRSVVSTTKELDAAMTQTAVVSTYTVKDMWKTLPQYSKEASKLGTSIKDVYNAQTLYVQQGLDMNTAMEIGVETMKMARVANIGAEEATNSMTAALRGFNMAIDEKSAKRVNDVYSKLAQNTASNTQEISTAMTKTAAIANSANMSFENTAAFLATIIESTREGAETAGTALKTVIARFTEVKKLYSQKELKGTDAEGQEIDVNKISAALRTAGINLNDFFTGSKGLDEILMQLGSKWNNLSTVQQRYIATMAAGSRQQSRFLALMQNYERTVSLTEMAYNSAGSGQEQFEKTLDSLDAKINQLKNSWDTFLMGLANSQAIKGTIDFATSFLDILNKIVSALSGSSGLTKSLATLSMTMGAFRIGRSVLGKGGLLASLLKGEGVGSRLGKTVVGEMITSFRSSKTTQELKTSLGGSLTNSLKKNFMLFGHGQGTFLAHGAEWGGQYFSKNQLENIKAEVKNYREAREEIQKEVDEAQKEYDEAAYNSQGKSLSQDERQSIQEKQDRLNAAKQRQKDQEEKYYDNQQKNGLSRQQATAAAENPDDIPKATINYKALANSALMAGAAITGLGVVMKNSGKFSDKAADSVTALGTALIALGTAAKILQAIGTAIPSLTTALTGPVGLAIAGVIAALVAAFGLIDALVETSEEKQKRINETISKNQTHIQDLENEYKQIDDSLGSIIEKQEGLDKLFDGTIAWKDAVKELNGEIKTLLENFPDFIEAVSIDQHGNWSINIEKAREIQKKRQEAARTAELQLQGNQAALAEAYRISGGAKAYQKLNANGDIDLIARALAPITSLDEIYDKLYSSMGPRFSAAKSENYVAHLLQTISFDNIEGLKGTKNYWTHYPLAHPKEFLKALAYAYEEENIKSSIISNYQSIKRDLLDEIIPADNNGTLRKFLSEKADEIFFKEYQKEPVKPEKGYVSQYYEDQGYIFQNGKYIKTGAEDIRRKDWIKEEDAIQYARIKAGSGAVQEFFGLFNQKYQDLPSNLQNLLLGKGKLEDYIGDKLTSNIQSILDVIGSDYEGIITDLFGNYQSSYLDLLEIRNKVWPDTKVGLSDFTNKRAGELPSNIVPQVVSLLSYQMGINGISGGLYNSIVDPITSAAKKGEAQLEKTLDFIAKVAANEFSSFEEASSYAVESGVKEYFEQGELSTLYASYKKIPNFDQVVENFDNDWALLNKIKAKTNSFTEEEVERLVSTGAVESKTNFTQFGGEYHLTKGGLDPLLSNFSNYLIGNLQGLNDALKTGQKTTEVFSEKLKTLSKDEEDEEKKRKKELFEQGKLSQLSNEDVKGIMIDIFGENAQLYNYKTGRQINIGNILTSEFKEFAQYYLNGDYEDFVGRQVKITELTNILTQDFNNISSEVQSKIIDLVDEAGKTHTSDFVESLFTQLVKAGQDGSKIFKDTGFDDFVKILGTDKLDWTKINTIDDFTNALDDLGISFDKNADGAKDLYQTLRLLYKTINILTAEDIGNLTQFGLQLKRSIKGKTDNHYTDEEVGYILRPKANKGFEDQFVKDLENGGYTFIGDNNTLEQAVLNATSENGIDLLEAQYELSKATESELTKGKYDKYTRLLFGKGYTKLNDEEKNQIQGYQSQKDYIYRQYAQAKEMLPFIDQTDDQARQMGASENVQKGITLQEAAAAGLNTQEVQSYADAIAGLNTNLQNLEGGANALAYAIAYDNMVMQQGVDLLASNFTTWKDAIDQGKEAPGYGTAIEGLNDALKKITGTTEDFSEEFLASTETMNLFAKAAQGDSKALADLKKAAAKNIIKPEGLGQLGKDLNAAIDKLDLENIEIGVEMPQDVANIFDSLVKNGQMSAESIAAAYDALNFEPPEITWTEMQVKDTNETTGRGYVQVGDSMVPVTDEMHLEETAKVMVPTVGGSAASGGKGGGVSKGGTSRTSKPPKSGGGGGGGNKEFKNDFDKYYNQVEDINELERQRNLLEKDYNQLLKSENLSGKEIYDNLKAQIELLKERRFLVQDLAEKRKQQILDTMQDEQYKDVAKYSWWNEEDQTIEIDWRSIDEIKDSETGDLVKEYVKKLEDFQSKYDEQINALEDIEDTLQEIKERGKEQYNTTEERLRDALIKQIQDKIDELTEVNEAINETNQKLFDSISETLELQRQERENAKTEEELADKEKRLAYLQQDSSNANALEIAKLQEELADARENYTDTLIDQKISELQKQNEEAQEQRQEQIDLMQRSLEWQENSGAFWNTVYQYISEGTDAIGALIPGSNLVRLLKDGEAWDSLSEEMQMNWLKELETLVSEATGYLALNRQLEDIGTKEGTEIEFITADGRTLKGKVDKNGNVVVNNDDGSTSTYKDVYQDYYGTYKTLETEGELKEAPKPATTTKPEGTEKPPEYTDNQLDGHGWYSDGTYHWHKTIGGAIVDKGTHNKKKKFDTGNTQTCYCSICNHYMGLEYKDDNKKANGLADRTGHIPETSAPEYSAPGPLRHQSGSAQKEAAQAAATAAEEIKEETKKRTVWDLIKAATFGVFATGGVADFTGPAWLDGTRSHPELVLNARDTQNFIELKDVLADMRKNGGFSLTGGNNYYDIKVQVDSLSSDYDVDRAIDRIKARIAQDGAYRNVNTLSRLR